MLALILFFIVGAMFLARVPARTPGGGIVIELRDLVDRFNREMARAAAAGIPEPTAVALATVAARPSVRMVLLKGADDRGFVVYTNLESRKGRELAVNAWAALCFWWGPIQHPGAGRRAGGAGDPGRGRRVLRFPAAREPDWRLGLAPERAARLP